MVDYFFKGGIMMYPLLFCSILSLAIILERFYVLYKAKINTQGFMIQIKNFLFRGKIERAIYFCDQTRGPLASILKAGILNHRGDKGEIREAIEEAAAREIPYLEGYLGVLATIASVATLLGFTGTVIGMINAFNAIARAGVTTPAVVAGGVSEALITTAFGLFIAIPTVVAHHYLTNRVDSLIWEMERCSSELMEILLERSRRNEVQTS